MKFALLKEAADDESRVALVPETVGRLSRNHIISVQTGAGVAAGFTDEAYAGVGAEVAADVASALNDADVLPLVGAPHQDAISALEPGAVVVGMLQARANPDLLDSLAKQGVTTFSMELIPRIARAQRADVLSSQASLAGYKAVLMAADTMGKFLPMMMTAAGTIPPARVLILGAGVAGLQAIATARRLGAVVEAFDVRSVVKEQVESLGAKFVESDSGDAQEAGGYARELTEEDQERQRQLIAEHAATSDAVITTAQIPNRPAPLLLTEAAVEGMRPGSVIVDLAAESGGNCALTRAGETVNRNGVLILGPRNVPSSMPYHASQMFSRNLAALFELIVGDDGITLDFSDEVVRKSCVTHGGRVVLDDQDSLLPEAKSEGTANG
ncbi:MAG: Re/Si-specific NAD(P)(+) transhydrogenase subunit alpha [Chloroflexi bacterium]|nr:Re/Si-specific NAD(P)(+) transhydrogenase subunit alpha [Chloroflexota bacterium]